MSTFDRVAAVGTIAAALGLVIRVADGDSAALLVLAVVVVGSLALGARRLFAEWAS